MTTWIAKVDKNLPNTRLLSPDSMGALVSLAYNRGESFSAGGDRRREMRAIKAHMAAKEFSKIPGEFRSMARLWAPDSGVHKRRFHEAVLFQHGLDVQPGIDHLPAPEADTNGGVIGTGAQQRPNAKPAQPKQVPSSTDEIDVDVTDDEDTRSETNPETPTPAQQDPKYATEEIVLRVQQQLRGLGYYSVGIPDKEIKGRTQEAILAFRNDNGLPLNPIIDEDLILALATAKPRAVGEKRATATASDLKNKIPAIAQAHFGKVTAMVQAIGAGFMGLVYGIGSYLGDAWTWVSSYKESISNIPTWIWIAGAVGVAGFMWWKAHQAENSAVQDYRAGKLL